MEIGVASDLSSNIARLVSEVDCRMDLCRDAFNKYVDIKDVLSKVVEENKKLQQEQHAVRELLAEKEALARKYEEQALEIKALRKKLQDSEARNPLATELCKRHPQPVQSGRARTRSMQKRQLQELMDEDVDTHEHMEGQPDWVPTNMLTIRHCTSKDELEEIRNELIKAFLEIDNGGRNLGIKRMGGLNEKPFQAACLEKLPSEEADPKASELCSLWQELLTSPNWHPFKTVTLDGNCQEVVNADDDKLMELKSKWGEGVYTAVVQGLMEMKEYNSPNSRSIVSELWNYKEGRKATVKECVQYMCNQMKLLMGVKRRMTRRSK